MQAFLRVVLFVLVIGIPIAKSVPPDTKIKGVHQLFKKDHPAASLLWAYVALGTRVLENIRIYGNYDVYDDKGIYPILKRGNPAQVRAAKEKDAPQDWVAVFIQFLFPSIGVERLVASTRSSDFTANMDIATVGRVMQAILTVDRKDKVLLAGAIFAALQPKTYQQAYNKNLKKMQPEKAQEKAWRFMSKKVMKVKTVSDKNLHKKDTGFARLLTEAVIESDKPDGMYPPNIVEVALGAWVWNKVDNKKQLLPYLRAMPELLVGKLDEAGNLLDENGNKVVDKAWLEDEYTKEQYINFKEQVLKSSRSGVKKLADEKLEDHEFAAYVGAGYNLHDVKLPPIHTYRSVKHPSLKGENPDTFPDCGSSSLRSFFEIVLYDSKTRTFVVEKLLKIAADINKDLEADQKIDISFVEADEEVEEEEDGEGVLGEIYAIKSKSLEFVKQNKEMERVEWLWNIMKDWHPLKRLIWFFKTYNSPIRSQTAAADWGLITSHHKGVEYVKGIGERVCEIEVGIDNMLKVISNLIPDAALLKAIDTSQYDKGTDEDKRNKANIAGLDRLCALFSTDSTKLEWKTNNGNKELKSNLSPDGLRFYLDTAESFRWQFKSWHFEIKTDLDSEQNWKNNNLKIFVIRKYKSGLPIYLLNSFISRGNHLKNYQPYSEDLSVFWLRAYGDLDNEQTMKNAIYFLFKNAKRKHYKFALRLMNKLPVDDERIKRFIHGVLLKDIEWLKGLQDNPEDEKVKSLIRRTKPENWEFLIESGVGVSDLFNPLRETGIIKVTPELINKNNWLHKTALNQFDLFKEFVAMGADVNVKHYGEQPLHVVAEGGKEELAKILLDAGAEVNAENKRKKTPLHKACNSGADNVINLLLNNGANIEAKDDGGQTPLTYAAMRNNPSAVKLLLDNGANIEAKDDKGQTPIFYSLYDPVILEALLQAGADINAKDKKQDGIFDHWLKGFFGKMSSEVTESSIVLLCLSYGFKPPKMVVLDEDSEEEDFEEGGAHYQDKGFIIESANKEQEYYVKVAGLLKKQLGAIEEDFQYPEPDFQAMTYLDKVTKMYKNDNIPKDMLAYWSNQVLSGREFGIINDRPSEDELDKILHAIAVTAKSSLEHKGSDEWIHWTIFKNDFDKLDEDHQEHIKNLYTFIEYARMIFGPYSSEGAEIMLKRIPRVYNTLELAGYPDIKDRFDKVIEEYK